jgi:hypothetical protein
MTKSNISKQLRQVPPGALHVGVGTRQYQLVDVFPVVKIERPTAPYIPAQ